MGDSEPPPRIEVIFLLLITNLIITLAKIIYALVHHLNYFAFAGKIYCNSGLLASWKWVSFLLEQYANN